MKIVKIGCCLALAMGLFACSSSEPAKEKEVEKKEVKTYESILQEYSDKIIEMTPGLVEDYNNEYPALNGDITEMAKLSNEKITELAEVSTEGIEEMASLMLDQGDEYEVYEEWAGKLQDVYMEYAQQITDAYMASAS